MKVMKACELRAERRYPQRSPKVYQKNGNDHSYSPAFRVSESPNPETLSLKTPNPKTLNLQTLKP